MIAESTFLTPQRGEVHPSGFMIQVDRKQLCGWPVRSDHGTGD
jgi:hypothetical protein